MCPPSAFFRDPGEWAQEGGARTGRPGVRVGDRRGIETRGLASRIGAGGLFLGLRIVPLRNHPPFSREKP